MRMYDQVSFQMYFSSPPLTTSTTPSMDRVRLPLFLNLNLIIYTGRVFNEQAVLKTGSQVHRGISVLDEI